MNLKKLIPFNGSCFWGHKWSKWEQYSATMFMLHDPNNTFMKLRQKKFCLRCNKMKVADI